MEVFYDALKTGQAAIPIQAAADAQREQEVWDAKNPLVEIDLPDAGTDYVHDSPGECADNLERLKSLGFMVPGYAIEALREEQAEADARQREA